MPYANLAEMFFTRARELATRPRYRSRVADGWREVTWQTMAERVRAIAARPEARSLGAIMGALRERFAGRFDGRQASEIARRVLAEPARV